MTLSTRIAAGLTGALACLAIAAPSEAAVDVAACKANWQAIASQGLDPAKYMTPCADLANHKSPQQRVNALGGRTTLIRQCEALHKPSLKDPRSYRYDGATIAAGTDKLTVNVTYRAKNAFNAYVPGKFTCTYNG